MFLAALSVVFGQEVDVSSFIRKAQGGNPKPNRRSAMPIIMATE